MRNLVTLRTSSVCFLVVAAAACRGPAGNNVAGNETNAVYANEAVPATGENSAANGAYGNEATANVAGELG